MIFFRYVAVSGLALAIDYSSYVAMLFLTSIDAAVVASISYTIGLLLAYILLKALVFVSKQSQSLAMERLNFILSGALGIATTFCITKLVLLIYPNPYFAKVLAVGFSFLLVYFYRKRFVFHSD